MPLCSCAHKTHYREVCDHVCLKRDLEFVSSETEKTLLSKMTLHGFPVAQMVEHGASNGKIMGSIPRDSKSW